FIICLLKPLFLAMFLIYCNYLLLLNLLIFCWSRQIIVHFNLSDIFSKSYRTS
ncbi:hypothetical protein L9F63_012546, partial [Diploptera punctata]